MRQSLTFGLLALAAASHEGEACMDVKGHEDAGYGGCQWYADNGQCGDEEDWLPASSCCVCGGGDWSMPATDD